MQAFEEIHEVADSRRLRGHQHNAWIRTFWQLFMLSARCGRHFLVLSRHASPVPYRRLVLLHHVLGWQTDPDPLLSTTTSLWQLSSEVQPVMVQVHPADACCCWSLHVLQFFALSFQVHYHVICQWDFATSQLITESWGLLPNSCHCVCGAFGWSWFDLLGLAGDS